MDGKQEPDEALLAADAPGVVDRFRAPGLLIYERVLPAVAASVARFRNELRDVLPRYAVDIERLHDIVLVVSEATTNAVLHGYADTSPGPLYVSGSLDGRALTVSVCDCGRGMRPRIDSPGAGLGMRVMTRLADRLDISTDRFIGTCVHATFQGATPAPPTCRRNDAIERSEMLREYVRVLAAQHVALTEDSRAVLAQAQQAMMHARRSRRNRVVGD